jgi:hypothetical protein
MTSGQSEAYEDIVEDLPDMYVYVSHAYPEEPPLSQITSDHSAMSARRKLRRHDSKENQRTKSKPKQENSDKSAPTIESTEKCSSFP